MANFSAAYLRCPESPSKSVIRQTSRCLRNAGYDDVLIRYREGIPWLAAFPNTSPGIAAQSLSQKFNEEVVALEVQTTVDYVKFWHYAKGQCLRVLEYLGEGAGWELVEGEPESWEAELHDAPLAEIRQGEPDPYFDGRIVLKAFALPTPPDEVPYEQMDDWWTINTTI